MDQNRFDDLARALATGTSRRQALKVLGGGLLAALVPGSVLAKGGGNSDCAKFCATTFGADTPAAKQCTADAAKGKGLCYSCGPASSGGTKDICCPTNDNGTCTSYSSATCCSPGQTCDQNGTCVTPTSNVCSTPFACGGPVTYCTGIGGLCVCFNTTEGDNSCIDVAAGSCDLSTCTSSADCPSGQRCIVDSCCGHGICRPVC